MIELPPNLKLGLEDLARETGQTEVEIILEAVERHLQAKRHLLPRSVGMMSDPEVTGENLEDWLAANWKPDWE